MSQPPQPPQGEQPTSSRHPRRGWRLPQWESAVERQIREAQERGEFERLPGQGQRLPDEPWEGDWALAYHVLRQAGETLPWIALGREIEERRARLQQLRDEATRRRQAWLGRPGAGAAAERERLRARYLKEAAELDAQLQDYSFLVPIRQLDKGRLPAHIAAAQFDAVWPNQD